MSPSTPAPVLTFETLDSTNAEARRRAEAGEFGPLWLSATHQTGGRGRRGRAWSGHPGNLAATLLTWTNRPPAEAALISFVAALAVAEVCDQTVPPSLVGLKWPNDVLVGGAKAAGILVESGPAAGRGGLWLAIGIGLNLAWAPDDVERPATALVDHLAQGRAGAPDPAQALTALAQAMHRWMGVWLSAGPEPVLSAWTRRAVGLPGRCTARPGHETLEGWAEGLEPDGALRLRLDDGSLRRITAGDVFFANEPLSARS